MTELNSVVEPEPAELTGRVGGEGLGAALHGSNPSSYTDAESGSLSSTKLAPKLPRFERACVGRGALNIIWTVKGGRGRWEVLALGRSDVRAWIDVKASLRAKPNRSTDACFAPSPLYVSALFTSDTIMHRNQSEVAAGRVRRTPHNSGV